MASSQYLKSISSFINHFSEWTGRVVSWLVIVMVLVVVYDVSMRFLFNVGSVTLQELEWHIFSVLFLLGAAYTLKADGHVRVDIFYSSKKISDRGRAWINVFGCLFFLIPFCLLIISSAWPFVANSFSMMEGSPDPGGIPDRFLLKAVIPVGFSLVLLQGIAQLLTDIVFLADGKSDVAINKQQNDDESGSNGSGR